MGSSEDPGGHDLGPTVVQAVAKARHMRSTRGRLAARIDDAVPLYPQVVLSPLAHKQLTAARQTAVRGLLLGKTRRAVAAEMGISVRTLEHHIAKACAVLGASGVKELMELCSES